ncbi:MAG: hypothetical protein JNL74_23305 [Fibrobacteres bacterium]|nr:hypothetical protein [Fibrobacterota bacterium]
MPQVKVCFTENLTGEQFHTRRYTVELTEDVAELSSIPRATATLFELAKREVSYQLKNAGSQQQQPPAKTATPPAPEQPQRNLEFPASTKQISAIYAIGKSLNMSKRDLEDYAGCEITTRNLSSKQASKLIEGLKHKQAA